MSTGDARSVMSSPEPIQGTESDLPHWAYKHTTPKAGESSERYLIVHIELLVFISVEKNSLWSWPCVLSRSNRIATRPTPDSIRHHQPVCLASSCHLHHFIYTHAHVYFLTRRRACGAICRRTVCAHPHRCRREASSAAAKIGYPQRAGAHPEPPTCVPRALPQIL